MSRPPFTDRMTKSSPPITSERSFSDLWERCLELRPRVVDRDGNDYEVIFPGIRNPGPGPDFKGAVVRHRGRTIGGDVELHLEPSGWRAHRHHIDPAYNGVVLQVVIRDGRGPQRVSSPPTALASFSETDQGSKKVYPPTILRREAWGALRRRARAISSRWTAGPIPIRLSMRASWRRWGTHETALRSWRWRRRSRSVDSGH